MTNQETSDFDYGRASLEQWYEAFRLACDVRIIVERDDRVAVETLKELAR